MYRLCLQAGLLFGLICFFTYPALGEGMIEVQAQNQKLEEVIATVSKQSGYTIHVSEDLLDIEVSGYYKSEDIESVFHKLLRKYNVFQVIDSGKKELSIFTDAIKNEGGKTFSPRIAGLQKEGNGGSRDIAIHEGGTTISEIRAIRQERQEKIARGVLVPGVNESGATTMAQLKSKRQDREERIASGKLDPEVYPGTSTSEFKKRKEEHLKKVDVRAIPVAEGSRLTADSIMAKRIERKRKLQSGEIKFEYHE